MGNNETAEADRQFRGDEPREERIGRDVERLQLIERAAEMGQRGDLRQLRFGGGPVPAPCGRRDRCSRYRAHDLFCTRYFCHHFYVQKIYLCSCIRREKYSYCLFTWTIFLIAE